MEDPLFDPWGDAAESAPEDATGSSRAPSPHDAVREAAATSPTRDDAPASTPRWRPVSGRPTPGARPAPKVIPSMRDERSSLQELPVLDRSVSPVPDEPVVCATPLKDVVLPALRALAQRLEVARHDVRIDDRTDRTPSSVRFQLHPWTGPFDKVAVRTAPVLEFVDEPGGDHLAVRTWLEPTAKEPSTARVMPLEQVERHLRRILLDFVERSLAG